MSGKLHTVNIGDDVNMIGPSDVDSGQFSLYELRKLHFVFCICMPIVQPVTLKLLIIINLSHVTIQALITDVLF